MTSEQLRHLIEREIARTRENKILAENPKSSSALMRQAAMSDYNSCGARLMDAATRMMAKLHEQMDWLQENPHHPKHGAVEDEWFKNLDAYTRCCVIGGHVAEHPITAPLPPRVQGVMTL